MDITNMNIDIYIGINNMHKIVIVQAILTSFEDYKIKKYGVKNAIIHKGEENIQGYAIVFPPIGKDKNFYIEWCPKKLFEEKYRIIEESEKSIIFDTYFWF